MISMHSPLFLLVLTLANAVSAAQFTVVPYSNTQTVSKAVRDYLDRLVPATKHTHLHELMGPTVGSDVNPYPHWISPYVPLLTSLFFHPSQASSFRPFPILDTLKMLYTGSGMAVASIISGSMS